MTAFRALLRHGLLGIVLAYAMAVQAMLAGPLLASQPQHAQHELCLTGEQAPGGAPAHGGDDCPCIVPGSLAFAPVIPAAPAFTLPMRLAVPFAYGAAFLPWTEGQGPESPAARGPPASLV